ncbi:putative bifunctional diguanylate cyclase/phosphodiesterase [Neptuniibacter pectenicola]|uniref:putative bifunctional diguanylate cyclase/phosphodiesterase n=1 Tax=Neptuniibacter pectenicola TaxID=1806669 RepID=UPI0030ED97BA|tara:strand:- start:6690 stop:8951 length:2262 start_codon:yes stop_codon:yes gene_type:complete
MLTIFNYRLIAALVLSTVIIMSVFGAVRFYLSEKAFEANLDSLVFQTSNRITSAVKPSIWSIYSKSVERSFSQEFASGVLDSELLGEYVVGVVVYGQFGHIYMGKWKDRQGQVFSYDVKQRKKLIEYADFRRTFPISFDTMTLGKVELFIDTTAFKQHQKDTLIVELIQIGIVSIFFVFVLFYMIKRSLLKPMRKLELAHKTFASMTEAIVYTDHKGDIYEFNNAFLNMLKPGAVDVVGKNIQAFFPEAFNTFAPVFAEGAHEAWQGEASFCSYDSCVVPVWLTVSVVEEDAQSLENPDGASELVFVFQDISERKNAEAKLQKLAFHDVLTGRPNRQYFEEELALNLNLAQRQGRKLSLIFIDLDNFKHINDALGHAAGDDVLIEAAKRFRLRLRRADFLARIGGDEFTVIVNGVTDSEESAFIAKGLIDALNEPIVINSTEFKVGASIGIANYPDDAEDEQELIKNADIAMYNAKDLGKNQISFFSNELNEKVEHYFELKNHLDLAIKHGEFRLYFQPKVDLLANKICAAEALIRWIKADGTLVAPDNFIPVAEDTKQIIPIGQWVIETAIQQLKDWQDTEFKDLSLSINVSAIQLYDESFLPHLKSNLASSGINPAQLEIEITETAVITDTETAVKILYELKKLDVMLSLDDFGTGYSSLSYLRLLPVDILKIDRSFIASAKEGNVSNKILASIIALARDLAIDVVAEGVEDETHLNLLLAHQCQLGQGYYFSRPLPLAQFSELALDLSLH